MSARKSARLADKAKPSYKYNILSSKRNSDSELVAHHPREKTVLPQHSDIDGSHGEGSRSSRPRQTKKRRIDSEGSEESETSLLKTLGAPRKTGKHTNVKWEQSSPALKIVQDSGTQENSTDLSEPPDKPIRTDFDTQKPVQPSRLDNAPESDDSALTYAPCRRKESLECLKFVNNVLIEHFRVIHSTDCVVLSSQLHERNEALLFYDNEDCQSPDSPCQTRSTEYVDAARSSPDLEDVSLPDVCTGNETRTGISTLNSFPFQMEFEAFDWDVEPGQELAACRETPSEIRLIETQELRNGDRADSSSAEDRGYVTAEEQVHFTPSPKPLMVSGANDDTAQPVREISESKLDYKRRQLDEQLAEFHRQEAAKTDLLTLTEGADSSDDDDLAEMLSRLKPRAKAPTVRRELRQRHPIQAKSINTPVAVLKSKEIEALEKVEAKERIRAQAMEYSKLSDQGDTSLASHRSFETNRDIIAPRLGEEFEDLGGLLGADVSQHTDVHLSIWRQLSEADYHRGPITDICQAIFGQVSTQQLRRKSFADWRDEIYRCADDLCAGRAAADNLIVPLISASYDLPSYGLELVRRAVRPALSGLQPSSKTNMIQHLANMMDEQDTEYFDAHVFGMLDGHRPFISWLSLKLLHPGLELSKVDVSFETDGPTSCAMILTSSGNLSAQYRALCRSLAFPDGNRTGFLEQRTQSFADGRRLPVRSPAKPAASVALA